jgi:hypothetical protein
VHQIVGFVVTKIVLLIEEMHVSHSVMNNELKREGQSLKRRAVLALNHYWLLFVSRFSDMEGLRQAGNDGRS